MLQTVPDALNGKRLDACVKHLFQLSWNDARAAIETGKITVAGARELDGSKPMAAGTALEFTANAKRPAVVDVVYEDESIIVVDKPSGISTVPWGDEKNEDTLDKRVRKHLSRGAERPELGVVHRIDKETSGLVVFTRTWSAKQSLSEQFRVHSVHRLYQALVHGTATTARIESRIVRDRGDGLRGSRDGGEKAVTHVELVEDFGRASLVRCRLETGRTHQIRIHMSEAGNPLIGEPVYVRDFTGHQIHAPRLMLHATELGFTHPSGNEVSFKRDMPADMAAVLQRLREKR